MVSRIFCGCGIVVSSSEEMMIYTLYIVSGIAQLVSESYYPMRKFHYVTWHNFWIVLLKQCTCILAQQNRSIQNYSKGNSNLRALLKADTIVTLRT